jgi:2-amino-4-hydroxy-6-hydroxymethyldihydropteridine diphosphokinase
VERWRPAYVGLGSNLGDPVQQVRRAFEALSAIDGVRVEARSPLYRSRPLGPAAQPDYVNAAAALVTRLDPVALLAALRVIEDDHGRRRAGPRWGPRTLDLDLLLYDETVSEAPELTLPHPGLTARNFVVYPLADIAPALVLPDGTRLLDLKSLLGSEGLERLA